ncbi:MAG: hypothetical protein ACE5HU_08100 [Acidobacteriota bacterium]
MRNVVRFCAACTAATILLAVCFAGSRDWVGVWTYDLCHEDRKPGHEQGAYCREGKDRIRVKRGSAGKYDIVLCPADPWGERDLRVEEAGRKIMFHTKDGLEVYMVMGETGSHYRGVFRTTDGHVGRIWGRRVNGCR